MNKIAVVLAGFTISVGCMTGGINYTAEVDDFDDTYIKVKSAGHTGLVRKGHELTEFYKCDFDRKTGKTISCKLMTTEPNIAINNSIAEQLAGSASTAYAGQQIGEGLRDSGDTVTNASNSEGEFTRGDVTITNGSNGGSGGNHPGCGNSGNC